MQWSRNDILEPASSPWDNIVWIYSISSLVVVLLVYFLIQKITFFRNFKSHNYLVLVGLSTIITIIIFRISYYLNINIPNNERSVILFDIEVHHIAFGMLFYILFFSLKKPYLLYDSIFFNLLLGLFNGMILDQVVYLSLKEVSDVSYNSDYSYFGVIILTIIYSYIILLIIKGKRSCSV